MQESTDLWYPDGSLVIKAGDTLFSVYSGFLAQRSTVFEDMFKAAQPDPEKMYNGRALVELFDDPNELMQFLKAVHDHQYLELQVLPQLSRTLCVMKLATKYQVAYLRSIILPRLLDQWYATSPEDFSRKPAMKTRSTRLHMHENAILIVNTARACNAPIMLPCALLVCSAVIETILHDVPCQWEKLSTADHIIIATATVKLSHALRRAAHQLVFFPSSDDIASCLGGAGCRANLSAVGAMLDQFGLIQFLYTSALQWRLVKATGPNVCAACIERWKACCAIRSREIWKKLPSYFGLPPWEELRKQSGLDNSEE